MSHYFNEFSPDRLTSVKQSRGPTTNEINYFDIQRSAVPRDLTTDVYYTFFSKSNVEFISFEITKRLAGVHPEGKNIIVPTEKIISVMDSIWVNTFRDPDKMTMMAISYIVNYIKDEFQTEAQNKQLSIWVTNFGEETGLRQHPKIKLREKGPNRFVFHSKY